MKKRRKRPRKPLTEQQKQAAKALFETGRIGDTASAVGVHRSTIWRWYKRSDFQRELNRVHDKWQRDYRRKMLKKIHNSPEYKKKQAARRRWKKKLAEVEKRLSEAGNSGNMMEYYRLEKEYNKAFNMAYFDGLDTLSCSNLSQKTQQPKKRREPRKVIVEVID